MNPSFVPAPPEEIVTSPDGLLAAKVDASHGSILLWANYGGLPETVVATNLYPDPSFEYGRTGWADAAGFTLTLDAAFPRTGSKALKIVCDTSKTSPATYLSFSNLKPNTTYTMAAWVRRAAGTNSGCYLRMGGALTAAISSSGATSHEEYERLSVTATTDGTTNARVLYLYGPDVAGEACWYDDLTLTEGTVAPDAFTGDTASDGAFSYRWTGAPGASTSEEYVPAVPAADPLPQKVRFLRGDGTPVRSGDLAWAPGGVAVAYDHEAQIGVPATYYAVPVYGDGTEGDPSDTLAVQLPNLRGFRDVWIKSPVNPNISALAWVENPPEISRAGRATFTEIQGSRLPVAAWDVRSGRTMTLTVVTETIAEAHVLEALLDAGPLLVQTRTDYDLPDLYCLPGDVTRTRVARMGNPVSRWTVPLTECGRPATLDAPLRIPGNSYAETDPDFPSYAEATATGTTYAAEMGIEL